LNEFISRRAEPETRRFKESSMTCPWRAIALAALLTLGVASSAFAQAADTTPAPAAPPPPAAAPAAESSANGKDPFGEELMLEPKTIIYLKGNSTWDKALESLVDAFKSVYALLDKQGIKRAGPSMTIYTQADDTGFQFQAAVPIAEAPKDLPKGDIAVGQSPSGKALKFVHRGSYDAMDNTYEAITNYLDEKRLEAADSFIEEYQTDPVTTPEDKFVVTVYVPLK
jgi:effector-binding domain-containing protein